MIYGKLAEIRWIPRPLSPSPINLPFPSPSTNLPSPTLSQASQRKGSALHSLCDSRRERELETARKRKPHRAGKCCMLFRDRIRAWKSKDPIACRSTFSWLLVGICSRCSESKEGRMGWGTWPAIQIAVLVMQTGCAADQDAAARDK